MGWGHIRILYKAPTDYTKPRQTIQSLNGLYKAPRRLHKDPNRLYQDIRNGQNPNILDKDPKYLTRLTTTTYLAFNIKYLITKTSYICKKVSVLITMY